MNGLDRGRTGRPKELPYAPWVAEHTVIAAVPPVRRGPAEQSPGRGQVLEQQHRYRLVEMIGEGGMGTIWRADDELFRRSVAIKILKTDLPEDYPRRFRREAELGAEFSHPNLVRVHDAGSRSGAEIDWIVMDYLDGTDLGDFVAGYGRLGVPMLLDVFGQALAGLAHIHELRLVHRDIKPYNLFLARRCYGTSTRPGFAVKVIDFGIARRLDIRDMLEEQVVGDPRYMAPEQTVAGLPFDGRADIYALGIALYEAATGRHPWQDLFDAPVEQMLRAHREQVMVPASKLLPGGISKTFASGLDQLIDTACAVNPDRRFTDAAAMAEALADLGHQVLREDAASTGSSAQMP